MQLWLKITSANFSLDALIFKQLSLYLTTLNLNLLFPNIEESVKESLK